MSKVIFETPTILDLNALTVFGLSAKPASHNPIGYFGTGLKYAMAILAREQCEVSIYIGLKEYKLQVKDNGFRGKMFQSIELVSDDERVQLPFTTELGKDWELWQAFRELYCNTIDENGSTYIDEKKVETYIGRTIISVASEEFAGIFEDRYNQVFLEDADTISTTGVQILPKESDYVYFRGIRVMKTDKPCLNTYNILSPVTLTEDRTAAYPFSVKSTIQDALREEENSKVLEQALNAGEERWESDFEYHVVDYVDVSEEFKIVASTSKNQKVKTAVYKISDEYKNQQRQEKENKIQAHFCHSLIQLLEKDLQEDFVKVAVDNKDELKEILEDHLQYSL